MNFLSLIEAKRAGQTLTAGQLQEIVTAFTAGKIPDYQMAAMLMAIFFRGLTTEETTALTLAMRDSGEVLEFPRDKRPLVDKHSTGGVGDKVSLPLAPLLACLGFRVPMVSGRGLGITGGTLDKLDSIPGFKTLLPAKRIVQIVQEVGCVICGQTDRMVPADQKLYALRDVTGTVPSIPLITASILSKKLAESLDALILDVKSGGAAFMQTKADARRLARAMVALGQRCGVNTRAMLTDMNTPLGRAAGNWLEVKESVKLLEAPLHEPPVWNADVSRQQPGNARALPAKAGVPVQGFKARTFSWENSLPACDHPHPVRRGEGKGEGNSDDLRRLVLECAAHLLVQTGKAKSLYAARLHAGDCLNSGDPLRKWNEMLLAQGADLAAFHRKLKRDHNAAFVLELKARRSGYVSQCDARIIGEVNRDLGGGRLAKESRINYEVGLDRMIKPGEAVRRGAVLARIHARTETAARAAQARLLPAFQISTGKPRSGRLIAEVIR